MNRRAFLGALGVGAAAATAGCLASGSGLSEDEYDVGMSTNSFLPEVFETTVGETVVWGNTGSRAHTVTAYENAIPDGADYFASGGFDGEQAARDAYPREKGIEGGKLFGSETYSHSVEVAGTYHYLCIPHEPQGMVGRIVVTE
jgi:plastocyanin